MPLLENIADPGHTQRALTAQGPGPWPDIWYLIDIVHISSEASIQSHELRIETQRPDIMQFFGSRKEPNKSLCGISVCVSVFNPELKLSLALSLYLSRHAMTVSWLCHGCVMNVSWICHECVLRKVFWTPKHSLCAVLAGFGKQTSQLFQELHPGNPGLKHWNWLAGEGSARADLFWVYKCLPIILCILWILLEV